MTLAYAPGDSLAHRLDPRTKLGFQATLGIAAFAHTTARGLVALTGLTLVVLWLARTSPVTTLREYRAALPFLALAPLVEGARLSAPFFDPADAVFPAMAGYRVLLLLLVGGAYVRTTSARESRAAVQWLVPGRPGVFLGAGVAFVLRLFPVLQRDLAELREAMHARLGTERSLRARMALIATTGLRRLFRRSDRFALALQARCFSWNPTLPPLAFDRADAVVLAASVGFLGVAVL